MYRKAYQRGLLTIFFSGGSKPLEIWETKTRDGYIKRFLDPEIKTMVLELRGSNISTAYISCPKGNQVLGITMPFLVMIVKNLMKYFSFEVTVLDSAGTRRRFRVSNFQSTTQILPLCTVMPIGLAPGWNQIQFNLAEFTRRAYKNQFVEVQKLKINANIRIRRIYFTEKLMADDELPVEYKLYFPLQQKRPTKERETDKENIICVGKEEEEKSSVKKLGKSMQTVPEEKVKVKAEATITEPAAEKPLQEEKPPEDTARDEEKQEITDAVATTETGVDEQVAGETEEKKPSEEAEETKGDQTVDKEGQEDKETEEKLAEGADKGEADKKPEEEGEADKGEGDAKYGEDANKGETKPDEETEKGEGDKKSAEEAEATI